jgi:hypothetical protein
MAFDLATSHSLLLLTMRTVSRLKSWGSNDGSGGMNSPAAASDDDDDDDEDEGAVAVAVAVALAAAARRGDDTGEGNGFGKVNKPMAKGGAAAGMLLISLKPSRGTRPFLPPRSHPPPLRALSLIQKNSCNTHQRGNKKKKVY